MLAGLGGGGEGDFFFDKLMSWHAYNCSSEGDILSVCYYETAEQKLCDL